MKRTAFIFTFFLAMGMLNAQQDPLFSQYMFNGLILNPAYAGSRDVGTSTLISRWQWAGIENAPRTYSASLHTPTPDRHHGFGFTLYHDQAWVLKNTVFNFSYAYRIHLKNLRIGLGVLGGMEYYRADLGSVPVHQLNDPSFNGNNLKRLMPNAGAGLYVNSEKFFAGISTPNFLRSKLYPYELFDLSFARRAAHVYLTGGFIVNIGSQVKFKPSFLYRWVPGKTGNLDLNASFLIGDRIWAGLSLRLKDAICFMAEFKATEQLRIGYAYDFVTSGLRSSTSGSHELRLGFDFGFKKDRMYSPRLF